MPPEQVMLQRYGLSRATLREALRLLEFEGVIGLRHGSHRGPVVLAPDAANLASSLVLLMQVKHEPLQTIVQARSAIEPMLCGLAASRIDGGSLAEVRATVDCMRENFGLQEAFQDASRRFHDIIVRSAGNALFGHLVQSLRCIMHGAIEDDRLPTSHRKAILTGHEEVYSALAGQDAGSAEARMRDHAAEHERYVESRFPQQLLRVVPWESSFDPASPY